jgi:AcrR family transcriptional regulator
MTRIANSGGRGRAYRSQLRADQAQETRARILDATTPLMARGAASLSIPAIAREAGVSVPTVYRHFATKQQLIEAIYPHVMQRAAINQPPPPRSISELRDGVRSYLAHLDSLDDQARAVMASGAADEVRRASMPNRVAVFRGLADSVEPKLADADRDRLARLLVVLTQSSSLRMWHDHLGLSINEVAEEIDWLVKAAIAAAQGRNGK